MWFLGHIDTLEAAGSTWYSDTKTG